MDKNIYIKHKNNQIEIKSPDSIEDLKSEFYNKFKIDKNIQFLFYIIDEDNEKMHLDELDDNQFRRIMIYLDTTENIKKKVIYAENEENINLNKSEDKDFYNTNKSNIESDNNSVNSTFLQSDDNFMDEIKNLKFNLKDIINDPKINYNQDELINVEFNEIKKQIKEIKEYMIKDNNKNNEFINEFIFLKNKINEKMSIKYNIIKDMEILEKRINNLNSENIIKNNDNKDKDKEIELINKKNENIINELKKKIENLNELNDKNKTIQDNNKNIISQLKKKIENLNKELNDKNKNIQDNNQNIISQLKIKIENLNKELNDKNNNIKELTKLNNELKVELNQYKKEKNEILNKEKKNEELIKNYKNEIEVLKNKIDELNQNNIYQDENNTIKLLKTEIKELKEKYELEKQIYEKKIKDLNEKIKSNEKSLKQKENANRISKEEIHVKNKEIERLSKSFKNQDKNLDEYKKKIINILEEKYTSLLKEKIKEFKEKIRNNINTNNIKINSSIEDLKENKIINYNNNKCEDCSKRNKIGYLFKCSKCYNYYLSNNFNNQNYITEVFDDNIPSKNNNYKRQNTCDNTNRKKRNISNQ